MAKTLGQDQKVNNDDWSCGKSGVSRPGIFVIA
jgi:hypothetical protein